MGRDLIIKPYPGTTWKMCRGTQPVHSNINRAGLILIINPGKYQLLWTRCCHGHVPLIKYKTRIKPFQVFFYFLQCTKYQ